MVFRVVSENSEADVARRRALDEMAWPLAELAANLIRTVRGAGNPGLLASQMVAVLKKFENYHDAAGCYPSGGEISEALSIRFRHHDIEGPRGDYLAALGKIVQGALQIAASEVLDQRTQMAAGESEVQDGIAALENYRASLRPKTFSSRSNTSRPKRGA